jgi:ribosome biogenesis GTPase / thiamine phosphate phosphatase
MKENLLPGVVIRIQSGFHTVRTLEGTYTCHLRGRLKLTKFRGDILAVGDHVQVEMMGDGTGMIEIIEKRQHALVRTDPTPKGDYQQVLLANPDQMLMVFACADPEPHLRMLDRFLVICEKQGIPARIVANKIDLVGIERAQEIFGVYPGLGYPVIYTSAASRLGLDDLRAALLNKITGLAGPSGVGKSSLLNAIQPQLGLAVREVSETTAKGRHTTIVRQMFPLNEGGFVVDLPGLRSLNLWDTQAEELDGYFPELRNLVSGCQYNDCTHRNESRCAVRDAVRDGLVSPERYESYIKLRFGE